MGFIEIPLGEAKPREPLEEGEYLIRVESVDVVESEKPGKEGMNIIRVRCSAPEEENSDSIFEHLPCPHHSDDGQARNTKLNHIVGFCNAFGIPFGAEGFEQEDAIGAEARLKVKQDEFEGRIGNKLVYKW